MYTPHSDRLDQLSTYPFTQLRALLDGIPHAATYKPIDLSLGEPRHPPPRLLFEAILTNQDGWSFYPKVRGVEALQEAITRWIQRRYTVSSKLFDPAKDILPLSGTREGLYMIAQALTPTPKEGEPKPIVLMPEPGYAVYEGAAIMAGAEPYFLPADRSTGFMPDLNAIPDDILDRAVLFYLCSPSNPQGKAASIDYLMEALCLARAHNFVLAVDECYTELYLDDNAPPASGLEAANGLAPQKMDNLVVFHSLSKRSNVPGLRAGFCVGDRKVIDAFAKLRSYAFAGMPLPVMSASVALWNDDTHVSANRKLYAKKFAAAEKILGPVFGRVTPDGSFFLWLNVNNGVEMAKRMWEEAAIKVLPGRFLCHSGVADDETTPADAYIRLALVEPQPVIEDAMKRILRLFVSKQKAS